MKKMLVLTGLILLFAVFVYMNWSLFIAEDQISLLGYKMQAPLDLIMLVLLVLLVLIFLISLAAVRLSARSKERLLSEELETTRKVVVDAVAEGGIHNPTIEDAGMQEIEEKIDEGSGENIGKIEKSEK